MGARLSVVQVSEPCAWVSSCVYMLIALTPTKMMSCAQKQHTYTHMHTLLTHNSLHHISSLGTGLCCETPPLTSA